MIFLNPLHSPLRLILLWYSNFANQKTQAQSKPIIIITIIKKKIKKKENPVLVSCPKLLNSEVVKRGFLCRPPGFWSDILFFFFNLILAKGIFVVSRGISCCSSRASSLRRMGSTALGLSCFAACGIEHASLTLQGRFLTTGPLGKPLTGYS